MKLRISILLFLLFGSNNSAIANTNLPKYLREKSDVVGFATVSKVFSGAGRNGYYSTRITVDADTSGIVTAYSSDNYAELRNSFKVSALAKGGAATGKSTLYYQQVQITGEG